MVIVAELISEFSPYFIKEKFLLEREESGEEI